LAPVREIERILQALGAAQHGVATRAQLMALGISSHAIDRMLRSGRLVVLHRGVYQIGPLPQARALEMSATLRCGPEGRISHGSAALMHGLIAARADRTVEVTMHRKRRRRIPGVRIHRIRDLRSDEVTSVAGIPVTTPARTLLDIAGVLRARDVEQALATALRTRLVTIAEVRMMVERHPRHGGAPLLGRLLAMEGGPAFTRSEAEEKLLLIIRDARLARPELNALVLGHEVDFLWRSARLVAEVDGYAFHAAARSFVADRRRDAQLAAAGYRVLRFTWADVTDGQLATAAQLAEALVR
jgi:very-short-patch-repair endonuclease